MDVRQELLFNMTAAYNYDKSNEKLREKMKWKNARPVALLKISALFRNPYTNGPNDIRNDLRRNDILKLSKASTTSYSVPISL